MEGLTHLRMQLHQLSASRHIQQAAEKIVRYQECMQLAAAPVTEVHWKFALLHAQASIHSSIRPSIHQAQS